MTNLISIVGCISKVRILKKHTIVTLNNQQATIDIEIPNDLLDTTPRLTPQNYLQVTGNLTTYLHHRCYSQRMLVKATSIRVQPPLPFNPTLHLAELLTTALYDKQKV